jgi:hypothetical protein
MQTLGEAPIVGTLAQYMTASAAGNPIRSKEVDKPDYITSRNRKENPERRGEGKRLDDAQKHRRRRRPERFLRSCCCSCRDFMPPSNGPPDSPDEDS